MTVYAIIHTETRVVRRMTSDDPPSIMSDETAIVVPDDFSAGEIEGPFKLSPDGLSAEPASEEEIKAALTLPRAPQMENLLQKAQAAADDPDLPQSMKDLATAVVGLFVV